MLKNFFVVAFRNFRKNGLFSLINVLGFSLGLAVFLLISLLVLDDLLFDGFHKDRDNIYRVVTTNTASGKVDAITSGALLAASNRSLPELAGITRVHNFGQFTLDAFGGGESEAGIRRRAIGADSNFFKVFPDFTLLAGDPNDQLKRPNTVVISEEVAQVLFGDEPALGQVIRPTEEGNGPEPATVTGVVANCPNNSHIQYDVILPALVTPQNAVWWDSWDNIAAAGYLRTVFGASGDSVQAAIRRIGVENDLNEQYLPTLQPLAEVHLGSSDYLFDFMNYGKARRSEVVALSVIAALTLLIASFNFVNLSSARAIKRAREVGMRKVVGAVKRDLVVQFLGESVLLTLLAMVIAGVAVQLLLPSLSNFVRREFTFSLLNKPILMLASVSVAIVVGVLAGLYPAAVLANFRPVEVLKGSFASSRSGRSMRIALVIIQFSISIALIASVLIVLQQLHYVSTRDQGFPADRILVNFAFGDDIAPSREAYLDQVRNLPSVEAVAASEGIPGNGAYGRWEGRGEDSMTQLNTLSFVHFAVDHNFVDAYDLSLLTGRTFSPTGSDRGVGVLLNETAVRELGWTTDAIGKRVILLEPDGSERPRTVVGVLKDFQYADALQEIDPMMLESDRAGGGFVSIRFQEGTDEQTVEQVRALWEEMFPERDFNYQFLGDRIANLYFRVENFAQKIFIFSALAIFIAALGLLGLTSYSTEQRRKEIAVRKVLGSSEPRVIVLLINDFARWVVLANLIAWPVTWILMQRWLATFVFKIDLNLLPFFASGVIALVIAVLTVLALAWRAALMNPADVLHHE